MANLAGVDLVDLSLAHEYNAIKVILAHASFYGVRGRVVYPNLRFLTFVTYGRLSTYAAR
jgi:hypothetical protein